MTTRDTLAATIVVAMLATACDSGPTDPPPETPRPGITMSAGAGTTDTVQATPVQALNILVIGLDGKPAVGAPVLFESGVATVGTSQRPTMLVGPVVSNTFFVAVGDTTDAAGVASVRVRYGTVAGDGKVVVTVPTLGLQDTARYTVTPGAAARALLAPRDTAVYVGGTVALRATVVDRYGNRRAESPSLSGSDGVTVSGTTLRAAKFGRHVVRATFAGAAADSTTVTALPRGRLAATTGYYSGSLVMMDLDGSNRVGVNLQGTVFGLDWAPDGRVVAGVGNSSTTLQAVDAAGQVTNFLTGSTAANEGYPVFSGDGKKLFFAGRTAGAPSYSGNMLWRANADGTGVQATTTPLHFDWGTTYGPSPDGSKLVFYSAIHDLETNTSTPIHPTRINSWRWSPQGDLVAFADYEVVGVMKPDGTGRRVFISGYSGFADRNVDWSGDGRYLVVRWGGSLELVEVETGTRAVIPNTAGYTQAALK